LKEKERKRKRRHHKRSGGLLLLGKTLLSKKAHEKRLTSIEFNGRPKLPGWQGKDGTAPSLGEQWL
jgi:hypothetical protein